MAASAGNARLRADASRQQALALVIDRVWQGNRQAYGARKVWRQPYREGVKGAV